MEGFEQMLQQVLSDPEKMQQIMGLAQSLGADPPKEDTNKSPPPSAPALDPSAMQPIVNMLKSADIDTSQKALLSALTPYVSHSRVEKLKKAMQAAKIAGLASTMLGPGSGR